MARRRKTESGGSLDSLMDTMANVVGILVILLIVTQLGVSQAVERMTSVTELLPPVDEQALEEARQRAEQLRQLLHELNRDAAPLPQQMQLDTMTLEQVQELIQQLQAALAEQMDARGDVQKLQELIEQRKKKAEELTGQITRAHEEMIRLRGLLDDTPMPEAPPPIEVNLPNPRSAPDGSSPVRFIVADGTIVDRFDARIIEQAQSRFDRLLVQAGRSGRTWTCEEVLDQFNRGVATMGAPYYTVELILSGRNFRIVVQRREGTGETIEAIKQPNSRFVGEIRRLARTNQHYAIFDVWPDSFELYLEARKLVDQIGLPAGWVPQSERRENIFTRTLRRGNFECEGLPPPPPPSDTPTQPRPPAPPRLRTTLD